MGTSISLNCRHCGEDFDYPSGDPREFYQGYTVCQDCVPCMWARRGLMPACKHEAARDG